jgi:hypothetical protein
MNQIRLLGGLGVFLLLGALAAEPCRAQRVVVYSPVRAPFRPVWVAPAFAPRMAVPVPRPVANVIAPPVVYRTYRQTYYVPAPPPVVYQPRVYATRVYYW